MIDRFKEVILKNINGKRVLTLFIVSNIVYLFMLLVTIPKVMSFSFGMKILDMMPTGYNAAYVKSLFATLGEEGRHAYLYNQIPVDLIYPFLFAISSSLVLAFFLKNLDKLYGWYFYLCFLPILAGAFDYLENFGIIIMLSNYPNLPALLIILTNIFSVLKSLLTMVYFILLLITFVAFIVQFLNKKETQPNN